MTYCHIELDRHDIALAEGLPAESYLDTGNRNAFANGAAMALHPVFGGPADVWEAEGYAPLTLTGKALDALRAALAQLADLAA